MSDALFSKCMLEGDELQFRVECLLKLNTAQPMPSLEKLITDNQIFLDPPHDTHVHGGPNAGWTRYNCWTATVSKRVRSYTNEHGYTGCVGRGLGSTPREAILRAIVASFGDQA